MDQAIAPAPPEDEEDPLAGFIERAKAIQSETQRKGASTASKQEEQQQHAADDGEDDVADISRGMWSKYIKFIYLK